MRNNVLIVNNPIWKTYPIYIYSLILKSQIQSDLKNLVPTTYFFNFFTLNILIEYFDISI